MKNVKKIILAVALLLTFGAIAQIAVRSKNLIARNGAGTIKTADTMVNADTTTLGFRCGYAYDLTFRLTNTKLTGTVVGTAVLQGTHDSVNGPWETITGVTAVCTTCKGASMTLSDGTVTGEWQLPRATFDYYRIRCITTGTATSTPTGIMTYKY